MIQGVSLCDQNLLVCFDVVLRKASARIIEVAFDTFSDPIGPVMGILIMISQFSLMRINRSGFSQDSKA